MDAIEIARDIRRRLGDRIDHPAEVMAEIERVVAERPRTSARVRVMIERELLRRGRVAAWTLRIRYGYQVDLAGERFYFTEASVRDAMARMHRQPLVDITLAIGREHERLSATPPRRGLAALGLDLAARLRA